MKPITILSLAVCLVLPAHADRLDDAITTAGKFTDGADSSELKWIEEQAVASLADPKLRSALELKLAAALSAASTRRGVDFLLRMLRIAGTDKSVPAVADMLAGRETSHMARYVLASMGTDAAKKALHAGLADAPDELKSGIVDSLGDLRHAPATKDIIKLLENTHCEANAARALGLIGGNAAAEALDDRFPDSPGPMKNNYFQALLRCAESFYAKGELEAADEIYEDVGEEDDKPAHLQLASLRGVVQIFGAEATPLLTRAIGGDDRELANGAAALVAGLEGERVGKQLLDLLASAPPDMQELLISSLAARGDRSAAASFAKLAKSDNEGVRFAAIEGLGRVGDASTVSQLAAIAGAATGHERNLARAALAGLRGDGIREALLAVIPKAKANPTAQAELVRTLASRGGEKAVPDLLELAHVNADDMRKEALRGLGQLAGESHLKQMIDLLVEPTSASSYDDIESAIANTFRRIPDPEKQAAPLLVALAGNPPAKVQPTLLSLLGRTATPKALDVLRRALATPGEGQRAAIAALARWPNATPADDLLKLATAKGSPNLAAALDGYISLAGLTNDPTAAYKRALDIASTPDIAKQVLAGLGGKGDARALALIEPYLAKKSTANEAAVAATQIAKRISKNDAASARSAVAKILASAADDASKSGAIALRSEFDQYTGYILDWRSAGPYSVKGKDAKHVFDTALAAETAPDSAKWRRIKKGVNEWSINLDSTYGSAGNSAAYARTRIWSPDARVVHLELSSDDAVKAWLNGKQVHAWFGSRGLAPRQAAMPVNLAEGWNDLVLKIVNVGGGWGFACRVRGKDGGPADGLKYEAK